MENELTGVRIKYKQKSIEKRNYLILIFIKKEMTTLHIKIKSEETYNHLMWFLRKLDKEEIQFVEGKKDFSSVQEQLRNELYAIDSGESALMELDEFDKKLDEFIAGNEN